MSEPLLPNEPIAVVGLSCRLPKAAGPREFWSLLRNGGNAVTEVPPGRWGSGRFDPKAAPQGTASARWGAFLDEVGGFDAGFFGISPRESAGMDPQQRLVLELGWEALEDAGHVPATLRNTGTAVFVGAIWDDYALLHDRRGGESAPHRSATGLHRSMIANRLSYLLGAQGPSLTVDSGQSSSLVAVHLACASLRSGEATLALAGGVNLNLVAESAYAMARLGALSPDGRCRTFDARANGFVRGEGGGMVLLKPLSRALAAGDRIYCLIRGSAVNNDGPSRTLTAPSADAQRAVLASAYRNAGVDPRTVSYVELHGTGTRAGDPVEASALATVLGAPRADDDQPLLLGSAKTNVGHLEGAAGIVGLLKTVLAISEAEIPASLNFEEPNPGIPFEEGHLRMVRTLTPWPDGNAGERLAGVSSFGLGGTNCHVVLASAPRYTARTGPAPTAGTAPPVPDGGAVPWVISARTRAALLAQAGRLEEFVADREELRPVDVAWSLAATRTAFDHRAVLLGRTRQDLLAELGALARGEFGARTATGRTRDGATAFVFPGQGGQWAGMAEGLRESSPVFRAELEACADAFAPHTDWSLMDVVREARGAPPGDRSDVLQPVLFAVMVSLAAVWRSLGVEPEAVVGHSQGEVAAAYVCGALSLEDAAKVVAERGKAVRKLAGTGKMASVPLPVDRVREDLAAYGADLGVAGINSPARTVVAGTAAAVDALVAAYEAGGVRARLVRATDYASHTPRVAPVREELLGLLAGITPRACDIAFYSTLTGDRFGTEGLDADYWYRNLAHPVRFEEATRALSAAGCTRFVESSPHPVLVPAIEETLAGAGAVTGSLQRGQGGWDRMLMSVAQAYTQGAPVDWASHCAERGGHRVDLPTYAFQRTRHWLDTTPDAAGASGAADAVTPSGEQGERFGEQGERSRERAERFGEQAEQAGQPEDTAAVAERTASLPALVRGVIASVLGHARPDDVALDRTFKDLGFDSITGAELGRRLGSATGRHLPTSLIFDCPTPEHVIERLRSGLGGPAPHGTPAPVNADPDEPIAIVSMACRYPGGAVTPEALWELVVAGGEGLSDLPEDRGWKLDRLGHPGPEHTGTSCPRRGGFLDDAAGFDADFFGISPREAESMDPQQRLLLETAWEAIERGQLDPHALRRARVGVFAGVMAQDYGPRMHEVPDDADGGFILTGTTPSVASGRISYTFGFEGPAVTVDTACSSSLVAIHLACQSLRSGECSMALAGGATVMSTPGIFIEFSRQRGLAPDGRCKAFADAADGTGWGEGVGLVLLERLGDARRNGHRVLAVVRGSAVNQDGASNGLTAPNGPSQERVIHQALAGARLSGAEVDVVEAHGTGTKLGDPIEAQALLATYGQQRSGGGPLLLGSLKSNIGHTQAAAGVAGVIKMVMAMRHGTVPPTLHVDAPSSHVDWSSGAVALVTEARAWPETGRPRRAAVSSFGISGTNAHVVLEQAPAEEPPAPVPAPAGAPGRATRGTAWTVSGRGPEALAAQAERLASWVRRHPEQDPADVAVALATTRSRFEHRAVLVGQGVHALTAGLDALAEGRDAPGLITGTGASRRRTVFVFPGQGPQWAGMADGLLDASPLFAAEMDACARALEPHTGWWLLDVLRDRPGAPGLDRVDVVQPALFAMMVGLAALWRAHGVHPDAVIGHSQGEIAAACVAGALRLPDAARVVALRSKALARVAGTGGMASLPVSADRARALLAGRAGLHIAALNGPGTTVVAGDTGPLERLIADCRSDGVEARAIAVDYASHTPHMTVLRDELRTALDGLNPVAADIPFYSTVTGGRFDTTGLTGGYWYRNLTQPVLFHGTVGQLARDGHDVFVESSPHPVLVPSIEHILETAADDGTGAAPDPEDGPSAVATLRRDSGGWTQFLTALGTAHVRGVPVDWPHALAGPDGGAHPVDLPTYAFRHQRYWATAAPGALDALDIGLHGTDHPLLAGTTRLPDGTWHATGTLRANGHPWLADHAVTGTPLLPATACLDLALTAGHAVGHPVLAELTLHAPVLLTDDRPVHLHLTVTAPDGESDGPGTRRVDIHSRPQDADPDLPWTHHATGVLEPAPPTSAPEDASDRWPPPGAVRVGTDDAYPRLAERGYHYGPAFRNLRAVWRDGDTRYADVRLAPGTPTGGHGVHPALLDAALHALLVAPEDTTDAPLLPFSFSGVQLHATDADTLRVRLTPTAPGTVRLTATDPAGRPVITVESLALRPLTGPLTGPLAGEALRPGHDDTRRSLFRLDWHPVPPGVPRDPAARTDVPRVIAVLGPSDSQAATALAGVPGTAVTRYQALSGLTAALATQPDEAIPDVIIAVVAAPGPGQPAAEEPPERAAALTADVLRLLQDWLADPRFVACRLVLTTTHAVAVRPAEHLDPAHAALCGLVRCAQAENPDRILLLDTDGLDSSARALHTALLAALTGKEPQIAVRDGHLSVPRFVPATAGDTVVPPGPGADWRLEATGRGGTLDQVALAAGADGAAPLGPREVRIAVRAAGLNFRDVMVSLGLVPVKAPIGGEDAGVVTETGAEVTDLAPGDRVMGMFPRGGIGPVRVADRRLMARIPDHWSFTDAATVPAAFLTAYHCLVRVAALRPGEKVLIHAATGGVGMAAVQLARHLGAEIYATASPAKWDTLRAMGLDDDHIASSRSLDFAEHVRSRVPGGLDVVLNSLAQEFVDASLRLLAPHGRFVEMGKTDIRDAAEVAAAHSGVRYTAFDLLDADPDDIQHSLTVLGGLFAEGALRPLPATSWPLSRAREALRHLSQARHTGKVTLDLPPALDPSGTVLITGGTGTLGAIVARHLITRHGVRHLVLAGRRGPDAAGARELHTELTGLGAQVTVAACDVADPDALAGLLDTIPAGHPLTAVVHAAGVLDDAVLDNLTPRHIETVFRPKAQAAWNLHRATEHLDLAAFVLFSSAAGSLGSPGQANYAAANAFLDALSHHRRQRGLPAGSLAWGLWEEASGMTGHLDAARRDRVIGHAGVTPLATAHGLGLLDTALRLDQPLLLAAPLTPPDPPPAVLRSLPGAARRRTATRGGDAGGLAAELTALTPEEQRHHLLSLVRGHAAAVLGRPTPDTVAAGRPFKEIGFDSLTAVELRNRLTTATRLRLSPTAVFDHPTPMALAVHLHGRLAPPDQDPGPARGVLREVERLESALSGLSPDDPEAPAVRARLEALVWAWRPAGSTAEASGGDDLDTATDDEVFAVIENELGLS
ncbi:type I polyketide synthase [Streptomyces hygroscopicus]|uniref:type I polyketide synthase n=1 Tax=Streptomyces hygroscopicus TaxID=1912 RepID=UPI000B243AF6|nr:type I polyketide synthase [Streptomyces sp. NBRC 109436]